MLILFKEKKKKCEARTLTFPTLRNHVRTEGSCPPTPWFTCRRPSARDAVFVPSHPYSFAPASAERGRVTSFDGPVWQAPRWLGQSRLLLSESSAVRGGCVCFSAPPGPCVEVHAHPVQVDPCPRPALSETKAGTEDRPTAQRPSASRSR